MSRKVYFISDLHLGARYIKDHRSHEQTIVEMLRRFAVDASHVYMLGDVLDYWFEYRTVVPRGYIRFFGALAELVDRGVKVTWVIGNHDIWLFDYLRDEIGIEIVDGEILRNIDGKLFYMAHGDALGGKLKPSFRLIRRIFRNRVCQKLYSAIHPRWTVPFALKWSSGSRHKNDGIYAQWLGDDTEPAFQFAREYLSTVNPDINYFILGHRHLLIERQLSSDCRLVILGDCFRYFTYACWDGKNLSIKQFESAPSEFKIN